MAKAIMVQGTTSNAGKSLVTAALCRIFRQDGYRTAPFKSQNMALNSFITAGGFEMGRAQVMQAEAAGILPDVRMNPILLKPTSDCGSQVIVNGKAVGNMTAAEYFSYKHKLIPDILNAYESLARENDIIVIEGAGSPAEINLKQDDIVNMGMAKMAQAPVLLVGDIDRGGVFASLYGTVKLLTEEEQKMVRGLIINKFRGDAGILKPGLKMLEDLLHIPVTGVIPYTPLDLDDEDSLSERLHSGKKPALLSLAVIRLPRLSNFTDFNPLERIPGVSLSYVSTVEELGNPDLILLPGSKNTMGDLLWMRQNGLESAIKKHAAAGGLVFGICGGYQMMGRTLRDPLNMESGGAMEAMGLLPVKTDFQPEKTTVQVQGKFQALEGIWKPLSGIGFKGYEIHMGESRLFEDAKPLTEIERDGTRRFDGAGNGCCCGTYVHGIFDCEEVAKTITGILLKRKGMSNEDVTAFDTEAYKRKQYDCLASVVRSSLDIGAVYRILQEGL